MRRMKFFRTEDGSVLVLTSILLVAVVASLGLAIDVGNIRFTQRRMQSAADAAALAATLQVSACGGQVCTAMQTAAKTAMSENGFPGATVTSNCTGWAGGTGLNIVVNDPPCLQGTSDPNYGNSNYVEVVASEQVPTFFAGILGRRSFIVPARAEAKRTANPNCVYALDRTGGNAITVNLLAAITSTCGIVDESSAWNAFSCNLIASVTAPSIEVTGGVQGLLCGPSTMPRTGIPVPTPADPLSGLPKPTMPACGTSTSSPYHGSSNPVTVLLGSATFYPDGAYCGGITVGPASNVTFMPGTYVLKSVGGLLGPQGGLSISLLANVSGAGVTFYNYGPYGGVNFVAPLLNLGSVQLSAPTSGPYACVLFYQDPGNTSGAYIIGSPDWNTSLQGAYYFPNANVLYAASFPVQYNMLVAKDIEFLALTAGSTALQSSFSSDYSSIPNGCATSGGGSVLVQ